MSEQKVEIKLTHDNWHAWDLYIRSTIRRKNAHVAFQPEPVDPQQTAPSPTTPGTTTATTTTAQPTAEDLKRYHNALEKWNTANNVAAGVILGTLSDEFNHLIDPDEPAKDMYDKLKAEVVKHTSGSSANCIRIELVYKQFNDAPTMENFEKHLTFYRSKNATLHAVKAGIDDSFLAWLLLNSFNANDNPVWSIASTNIVTSDIPITQWSFNQVAGKLREALRNTIRLGEKSTSGTSQAALNATTDKAKPNRYNGSPCTHPGCQRPKTHATENCWTKERENRERTESRERADRKKHKAKKAKKKAIDSGSEPEASPDSDADSEPSTKKRQRANLTQTKSSITIRALKTTSHLIRSCHGKTTTENAFVAHPDSGASNHMTHRKELFDPISFKTLAEPISISLGDDSEIFATGKGTIRLLFNVDGQQNEGCFNDVLFVPDLKVTLLSVGQSARLPHCKVVFDGNVCEYISKDTNEVIARALAHGDSDLYTLDATPVSHKAPGTSGH